MGFSLGGMRTSIIIFEVVFAVACLLILTVIIVILVKGLGQWKRNNASPRLTVEATVVSRRISVSHTRHANAADISGMHGYTTTASTTYYATFEVASGDRMELVLSGSEYGMLAEGDRGLLSFQGTRYLGFERR